MLSSTSIVVVVVISLVLAVLLKVFFRVDENSDAVCQEVVSREPCASVEEDVVAATQGHELEAPLVVVVVDPVDDLQLVAHSSLCDECVSPGKFCRGNSRCSQGAQIQQTPIIIGCRNLNANNRSIFTSRHFGHEHNYGCGRSS